MGSKADEAAQEAYRAIAVTFSHGVVRLLGYRIAALSACVAILKANTRELPPRDEHQLWDVVERLQDIAPSEYLSFEYMSNITHLVYATALFDTFLSETTRFLFLKQPRSLGNDTQLSLRTLLESRSRADAINRVVDKRVRELGFSGFKQRIEELERRFGLVTGMPEEVTATLERFASTRSTILHDQGLFQICLDSRGRISTSQRACLMQPTPISNAEAKEAVNAYGEGVRRIALSVMTQVLHLEEDDATLFERLLTGENALPDVTLLAPAPEV